MSILIIKMTTLGNLTPSSTVFFCCDMQERFRPAIKYFGDIISVGQRLLQGARLLGIPVIVTEQYPKGLGSTVQEIDLTGAKLVLPKTKFSMVLPEVEAALAEIPGVRSVVLFGVETHVCIQQTALELIGRGLEVHIVADATSSRSMMDRMFALERLARTGIIVTTSEAILLQLVADKEHPKFKEIQNLIKGEQVILVCLKNREQHKEEPLQPRLRTAGGHGYAPVCRRSTLGLTLKKTRSIQGI
nr:PREDICTED: isochorismatase domain-containing protein 1 isoform X2 [Struthio camelus australis]